MDTSTTGAEISTPETYQKTGLALSFVEILLIIALTIYLIHVLMGWTYAFFWWPLQS